MLVSVDGTYVDVVREAPYTRVITVRASDPESLARFASSTCAEVIQVPHPYYPYMIHIDEYVIPLKLHYTQEKEIEVVDRLTPEPVCFVYEYAYEEDDGTFTGEYGYCYPNEVQSTTDYLMSQEKQPVNEPVFLPIFYFPGELVGAPIKFADSDVEDQDGFEEDE